MVPPGTKYGPTYAEGRFLAFTTLYKHPADRPPKTPRDDSHIMARYTVDEQSEPLYTYARGNSAVHPVIGDIRRLKAQERP